jgi:GNAT superfamily N-acetyltransferase
MADACIEQAERPPDAPKRGEYTIASYDCDTQLEKIKQLAFLAGKSEGPMQFDSRVLPWTHGCGKSAKTVRKVRHYVAQRGDDIVGWLLAETRRRFGRTYVYLSEISVTQVEDKVRNIGIGKALHELLLKDATKDMAHFIYLYPLTEKAGATYTNWGYHTLKELNYPSAQYLGVKHMFLALCAKTKDKKPIIPPKLLDKLNGPSYGEIFPSGHALAASLGDEGLAARIQSRAGRDDQTLAPRLREALENIAVFGEAGEEGEQGLTDKEKLDMLRELFPAPKGGRRTRRRKTRRRLTHKRKHKRV